jgi:hypothetical protein
VVVDEVTVDLPAGAAVGKYRLAVGLYQAASGLRLPLVGRDGAAILDDRLVLPVTIEVAP